LPPERWWLAWPCFGPALGQEIEHVPRRRGDMLHAGRRVRASSPCRSMNAAAARYMSPSSIALALKKAAAAE